MAKILENPTLEQNGRFQGDLLATIGPQVSCMGPIDAMILLTARTITLKGSKGIQVCQNTGKSDFGAKRTLPGSSDGNHWALGVLYGCHRSCDFTDTLSIKFAVEGSEILGENTLCNN